MAQNRSEDLFALRVPTERGPLLDGVLFHDAPEPASTVLIAIMCSHSFVKRNALV